MPTLTPQASRVAVVREKVDDLASAVKQAEQELKVRVEARQSSVDYVDDYVDPTDAVDLPPPSADSPFAFQASALHGLGVENSLGAAMLAERLPPGSPGVWSLDPDEEAWRKALLHEAVDHSLSNTPAHSSHTASHAATPSSGSMDPSFAPSTPSPAARTSTPSMKRNLGQRIVDILEDQHEAITTQPPAPAPTEAAPALQSPSRERTVSTASRASRTPLRAETPAEPQTPLPPPPRTPGRLPRPSTSTDSPVDSRRVSQISTAPSALRKTSSSPMLHFWHDMAARRSRGVVSMTPPLPPPRGRASSASVATLPSVSMPRDSITSGSHYSLQDHESMDHLAEPESVPSRPSFSSLPSRPSTSEYSQISPTVSAFNDGLFASVPSIRESLGVEDSPESVNARMSRDLVEFARHMSPPPRTSSSLAIHSLHPPPRFLSSREASPTLTAAQLRSLSPRPSLSSSDPGSSSERPSAYVSAAEHLDVISSQTRLPTLGERRHIVGLGSLLAQSSHFVPLIHTEPPPASPLEFFDQIQTDRSVMYDWEETSDESDTDVASNSVYVDAAGHASMQNSSPDLHDQASVMQIPRMTVTPSLLPTPSHDSLSLHTNASQERLPVVNVPRPTAYFKDAKGEQALSSYDLYRLSRSAVASSSSRASSETQARSTLGGAGVGVGAGEGKNTLKRDGRTASVQRLDGLMLQHIEAERGTMSRIAKTAKDASS
ncbi:hypothetical protein BC834DRAFT_260712 [Gloeopeniophorella convolvens]|nr:hypothetical protein BC834DRAFT_260712 [Gloeopeniophorella convolvens]